MKQLLFIASFMVVFSIRAQDKVFMNDGRILKAKVTEVGLNEIRYKKYSNLQGPTYVVHKLDVLRIEYENGSIDYFSEDPESESSRANPKPTNTPPNQYEYANVEREEPNLRIRYQHGITAMLLGPTVIGSVAYEYFIDPNWNLEFGIGLIGVYSGVNYHFGGANEMRKSTPYMGLRATAGMHVAEFLSNGPRFGVGLYAPIGINVLFENGFYLAPELAAHYTYSEGNIWLSDLHAVRPWLGFKLGYRFGL
jgi:hypothetical protein